MNQIELPLSKEQKEVRKLINDALDIEWDLTIQEHKSSYAEKLDDGTYVLSSRNTKAEIARWKIVPMINCCGIAVSTQATVSEKFRGKGLGTALNKVRILIAKSRGYSVLLCTDVVTNGPQRKILAKNGWKDVYIFHNGRTGNNVAISLIEL